MKDSLKLASFILANAYLIHHHETVLEIAKDHGSILDFAKKYEDTDILEGLKMYIPEETFRATVSSENAIKTIFETGELVNLGIQILMITDDEYPSLLKDATDAPLVLYVKSSTPCKELFNVPMIAVVGTRDPSLYGIRMVNTAIDDFGPGPQKAFVSGLAMGTDTHAHRCALASGYRTIAVTGTGVDTVYPHQNKGLEDLIVHKDGCAVVTPFPPGTAPQALNFLIRNRIIAAMCQNTVVTETKAKGGAMVIARLAKDYGHRVYAFPGRLNDVRSTGCNQLIKEGIAEIYT